MSRKFISFEDVEQLATIEQLAERLGLETKQTANQLRCACPVHGGDDRALCISPTVRSKRGSVGVFFCQSEKSGGDRIGLVAHVMGIGQQDAAFFIADQFGAGTSAVASTVDSTVKSKTRATVPQAPRAEPTAPTFDPLKFASKLVWSEEVKALGLTEEEAERLGVGYHPLRKAVYFPIRNPDNSISGFIGCDTAKTLKLPPQWLAPTGNVVRLKRA